MTSCRSHPKLLHMVTWVKSPWGIPANYRQMEGSGVNTYKLVNAEGVAHLVKFHWQPKQGVKNLTSAEAGGNSGARRRSRHQGSLRGDRARRLSRVGVLRPDHVG